MNIMVSFLNNTNHFYKDFIIFLTKAEIQFVWNELHHSNILYWFKTCCLVLMTVLPTCWQTKFITLLEFVWAIGI